jgi:hypothetical protein
MKEATMLTMLEAAERELPALLRDTAGWKSLFVDYHAPFVERVYREWNGHRLYLHCIHPCAPEEALFHPHPWPSAMRVHSGKYEMGVGFGSGDTPPPLAAKIIASGAMTYEMTDPDAWHYVRPLDGVALTVMLSGPPWQRTAPRPEKVLSALPAARVGELREQFRAFYAST